MRKYPPAAKHSEKELARIEAAWRHPRLKPKDWRGLEKEKFDYYQEKLDGHRATIFKQEDGSVVIFGRDDSPHLELSRFPRLVAQQLVRTVREQFPPISSVDFEIIVPGHCASDVPSALRSDELPLKLVPFAVPWFNGKEANKALLLEVRNTLGSYGLPFAKYYKIRDEPKNFQDNDQLKDWLLAKAKAHRIEGWILKRFNYDGWYKLKIHRTLEAVVSGTIAGEGKYAHQVGALLVSVYSGGKLVEIASTSGMSDHERRSMTTMLRQGRLVGKVCEVEYQEATPNQRLRHPRFLRWRYDKNAQECRMTQLFPPEPPTIDEEDPDVVS